MKRLYTEDEFNENVVHSLTLLQEQQLQVYVNNYGRGRAIKQIIFADSVQEELKNYPDEVVNNENNVYNGIIYALKSLKLMTAFRNFSEPSLVFVNLSDLYNLITKTYPLAFSFGISFVLKTLGLTVTPNVTPV